MVLKSYFEKYFINSHSIKMDQCRAESLKYPMSERNASIFNDTVRPE